MKKIILLIAVIIVATTTAQAQLFKKKDRTVETEYAQGTVPVVNGKVSFEATIPAEGLTAAQVQDKVNEWIAARFVKPTVISAKRYDEITYKEIVDKELKALDLTAATFCMDNDIKCYAFELKDPMNIYRVTMGEKIGTELHR